MEGQRTMCQASSFHSLSQLAGLSRLYQTSNSHWAWETRCANEALEHTSLTTALNTTSSAFHHDMTLNVFVLSFLLMSEARGRSKWKSEKL